MGIAIETVCIGYCLHGNSYCLSMHCDLLSQSPVRNTGRVNDNDKRDLREKFRDRISELRQLSGKTLEQFGAALGISAHGAGQIERGEVFPVPERLEPIARFLRVEVMDLFDSRAERKMPPLQPKERQKRRVARKPKAPETRKNSRRA